MTWTTATSVIPTRLIDASFSSGVQLDVTRTQVWVAGVVTSLLFFGSIVAHEAAHTVAAVRTGIPVRRIRLFIFGGVAEIEHEPERPGQEFFITIVGPLTSAAFGGLCLVLADQLPAASIPSVMASWLGQINLWLAAFNMLPGFPLDGGRILRAIVWAATGNLLRGTRVACFVGSALGAALMAFGLIQFAFLSGSVQSLWMVVIGWFLWSAARSGYRDTVQRERLRNYCVRDFLRPESGAVPADGTVQEFIERGLYHNRFGLRPVVDSHGTLVGTLHGDDVRDVRAESRIHTRLRDIAQPVDPDAVLAPDDRVEVMLNRASEIRRRQFFVVEHGRLIGSIDALDALRPLQR